MTRSILDFVEDLLTDGRDAKHILAVAQATRWASRLDEIKQLLKKYHKKNKKH